MSKGSFQAIKMGFTKEIHGINTQGLQSCDLHAQCLLCHNGFYFHPPNPPLFRWFKFTLKPPNRITHDKLRLAIWDTSFWTFWLKFGHKGP